MEISETADFDISVLIPTLNEEESIKRLLKEIKSVIQNIDKKICIVITDNGSSDKTVNIARDEGVFINTVKDKGYGANLISGINSIKSEFIIFFDADGSYIPSEIEKFIDCFDRDASSDLVTGNRLIKQEKGSMPYLNKFLGTPVLSYLISFFFKIKIKDCNSGMRMFRTSKIKCLELKCKGMEFASEMIIKAKRADLVYKEIEINFRKDFRSNPPHLNRWSDGWRHLKFIYANAPDKYLLAPIFLILSIYFIAYISSFINTPYGFPRYHTIFSLIVINQFLIFLVLGLISLRLHIFKTQNIHSSFLDAVYNFKKKNSYIKVFLIFTLFAFIEIIMIVFKWISVSFLELNELDNLIRMIIYTSIGSIFILLDLILETYEEL